MALWICDECTTAYAVDAPACPQCGGKKHHGDHDPEPEAPAEAKPSK